MPSRNRPETDPEKLIRITKWPEDKFEPLPPVTPIAYFDFDGVIARTISEWDLVTGGSQKLTRRERERQTMGYQDWVAVEGPDNHVVKLSPSMYSDITSTNWHKVVLSTRMHTVNGFLRALKPEHNDWAVMGQRSLRKPVPGPYSLRDSNLVDLDEADPSFVTKAEIVLENLILTRRPFVWFDDQTLSVVREDDASFSDEALTPGFYDKIINHILDAADSLNVPCLIQPIDARIGLTPYDLQDAWDMCELHGLNGPQSEAFKDFIGESKTDFSLLI